MIRNTAVPLVIFFALVASAALIGSRFMPDGWYRALAKPPWNPPDWVFGPVWTALYICIAIAGFLAWRSTERVDAALVLWGLQLILNASWSWLFFGRHEPGLAMAVIVLMLVCIFAFIFVARSVSPPAAWLFVPYAAWVLYASTLNLWIWLKNAKTI